MACSTAPVLYPSHPLSDQIIKARKGHDGNLTNRECDVLGPNGDDHQGCAQEKITDYPLADANFRATANKLNFLCNIGGKRFKICQDKPGFCRFSYTQKCVLFICGTKEREEEYLPVEQYGFLLDANARCASKDKYDLWSR